MASGSTLVGSRERSLFTRFSQWVAVQAGRPTTFVGAMVIIVLWGLSGPFAGFGDTWQLVINTSTTIITFLMVFVIQNSQNRDTAALHIKIDELIARLEGPRRVLLDLEELDDTALEEIRAEYEEMARIERERDSRNRGNDGGASGTKTSRSSSRRTSASRSG